VQMVIFWLVLFLIPLLKMDFYVSIAAYLLFAALFRADVHGRKSVLGSPGFAEKTAKLGCFQSTEASLSTFDRNGPGSEILLLCLILKS
jgi:hypothetical protein